MLTDNIELPKEGTYVAKIIRNSDCEISFYSIKWDWTKNGDRGDLYWWTDGNFGCDCNRYMSFERGKGREPKDDYCKCGYDCYTVPYVILPDGIKIKIDDVTKDTNK